MDKGSSPWMGMAPHHVPCVFLRRHNKSCHPLDPEPCTQSHLAARGCLHASEQLGHCPRAAQTPFLRWELLAVNPTRHVPLLPAM